MINVIMILEMVFRGRRRARRGSGRNGASTLEALAAMLSSHPDADLVQG